MATTPASVPTAAAPSPPEAGPRRRILCTIDFSEASAAVVAEAVSLAGPWRAEITILFVIPYAAPSRADPPHVPAGVSSAVAEDVEALVSPAREAGIPVRVCLRAGRPAHQIIETVRRLTPDVIVMGTHGRGGLKRRVLGSVTSEVLRSVACPVLVIGRPRRLDTAPRDAVLCAVGLSPSSPRTLAHALEAARASGAGLTLMHVFERQRTDRREASGRLHALAAAFGRPGDRIEEVVVAGVPTREILRMAAARRAALVVIGGERGSGRALDGSTADRVIRGAPCAVLTVRSAVEAG